MVNDTETLARHLSTRRSGRPREMVAPGPSPEELRGMIALAARTPDHGKLAPWRFVIVPADRRDAFAALLVEAYRAEKPAAGRLEIEAMESFARQAPALVVVLHRPRPDSHIPRWEQELSTGAACMNLLHAAHAAGYVAGWLTGWAAYSDAVRDAFGAAPERIAGFVFMGKAGKPLEERARPDIDDVATEWC